MIKPNRTTAEEVAGIIQRSGYRDAFFTDLFAVNQSTVSRLRAAKIKKANKYLDILIKNKISSMPEASSSAALLWDLIEAADSHPELAEVLEGLQRFVHKIMHK